MEGWTRCILLRTTIRLMTPAARAEPVERERSRDPSALDAFEHLVKAIGVEVDFTAIISETSTRAEPITHENLQ